MQVKMFMRGMSSVLHTVRTAIDTSTHTTSKCTAYKATTFPALDMRALRFHENKDIRLDDIPEPTLRPGWVKVKNAWCGICGSDLHEYTVGPMNTNTTPHILTGEVLPAVCGHEFAGTVVELGEGVTDTEVGQKVAVFPILSCMNCHWCEVELYRLCEKWGVFGYSGWGGGMAEYICVDRRACHKIPNHISLDVAALVEPLAVGWHAVKRAKVGPGDDCLVLGAGPIGISVVHCLVAHGFGSIIVSEPSPLRLSQAKAAGATHLINPLEDDVAKTCRSMTNEYGAHAVFECAGLQQTFDAALGSARGSGVIVNVAIYETGLQLSNANNIGRYQLTITGSNTYTRAEFDEVIDAIATGRIMNPENMITSRIPLDQAVTKGFEQLLTSRDKHVKILINPGS